MKIEAGKYYRTRDGRKAYVAGCSPFKKVPSTYEFVGHIENDDVSGSWTPNGAWYDGDNTSCKDLVAEWKEPRRIKGWVRVSLVPDRDGDFAIGHFVLMDRQRAKNAARQNPGFGLVEVDAEIEEVE